MLLKFEVSNHRSILAPVTLSMIAVDENRPSARRFDLLAESVLAIAGIYGPNASGKSNVLDALEWLSKAVRVSLRAWDEFIPRDPFKFGSGPMTPSTYEVEMVVKGVRYAYILKVDGSEVLFEALYSYPKRVMRTLFERNGLDIQFRRGLGGLAGTRKLLTPDTLALSAAMRYNEPEVQNFGRSLAGIRSFGMRRRGRWSPPSLGNYSAMQLFDERSASAQSSFFDEDEMDSFDARESALQLLRLADRGIDDVRIVEEQDDITGPSRGPGYRPRRQVHLIHRVGAQEVPFDREDESAGTQTWFDLIAPTLYALRYGRVLLFDELDASLHPRLTARLLELYQDPETNPYGAQLIFTTHDTSLLNHLNRDEVWLTEKGADGATTLTALAEYNGDKVRKSLNLEKAYLQGRFGSVPEFDHVKARIRSRNTSMP